jgi:RNA polymerase sigma factor (sigma-70 family)
MENGIRAGCRSDVRSKAKPPRVNDLKKLVRKVVQGDADAWKTYVERISNLLFSLLWRFTSGDHELCSSLYLYVIERLQESSEGGETFHRLRRYLDSLASYNGTASHATWLGKVTQNLVSDYFRERLGRRTLPRAIRRMSPDAQMLFKLLHWESFSETEALEIMRNRLGGMQQEAFDEMVEQVTSRLKRCNRWSLYSENVRRSPVLVFNPETGQPCNWCGCPMSESSVFPTPAQELECKKQREKAKELGCVLRRLIEGLPDESRMLLTCRYKEGMTIRRIARHLNRNDHKRIYNELDRLKRHLGRSLKRAGFTWEHVEGGLDAIEEAVV